MRVFEWEALRVGDLVSVHETSEGFPLRSGSVSSVAGRFATLSVGVVLSGGTAEAGEVRWPVRLAVHLDPLDGSEPCWRCEWKVPAS